jgi:hypothetical protein
MKSSPIVSALVYTMARFGLLGAFGLIGYLLGLRSYLLIGFAFVTSAIASLFLLDKLRDKVSEGIFSFKNRINLRIDEAAAAEDAWIEEQLNQESRKNKPNTD